MKITLPFFSSLGLMVLLGAGCAGESDTPIDPSTALPDPTGGQGNAEDGEIDIPPLGDQSGTEPDDGSIPPNPGDPGGDELPPYPRETANCRMVDGEFTEEETITSGKNGDRYWAEGRTCIHRPIKEAWAVIFNHQLMEWREIDETNATRIDDQYPTADIAYALRHKVNYALGEITWRIDWLHFVREGTVSRPWQVYVNFQKVKGTDYIKYFKGSVLLEFVDPEWTSFGMAIAIDAMRQNDERTRRAVTDVIGKLRSGDPVWDDIGGPIQ